MIAWLLIQDNKATGEINKTFVTGRLIDVGEHTIQSGTWKDVPVEVIGVEITALNSLESTRLNELEGIAFRTDGFIDSEEAVCVGRYVSVEASEAYLETLKEQQQ